MQKHLLNLLISLLLIFSSCGNYCDDYLFDKEVEGVITRKYVDYNSHSIKKLEITPNNQIFTLVIEDKDKIFWNYIKEGYFLSKRKNSTEITITRNKEKTTFNLCSDSIN